MKKSIISILAVSLTACILFAGCAEKKVFTYENEYVKLGEYKGLTTSSTKYEITDKDVEDAIKQLLSTQSDLVAADRDTVEDGDVVNIDYKGEIKGVAFEGGTAEGADLTIGSGQFIDGFEEQLIGAKLGETVEINVTFPKDYPNNPDLANKKAKFTVTINSISTIVYPELTDALAKELSNGQASNVTDYKALIKENLNTSKQQEVRYNKQNNIWLQVVDNSEIIKFPDGQIETEVETALAYYEEMAKANEITLEDYVTNYYRMDLDEFKSTLTKQCESMLKQNLIIDALAEAEGITVSDEEYKAGLQSYATDYGFSDTATFEEQYGKENIMSSLLSEKVMDMLEKASVEKDNFTYESKE